MISLFITAGLCYGWFLGPEKHRTYYVIPALFGIWYTVGYGF